MTLPQDIIGGDIAKDWLDTFQLSPLQHRRIPATKQALARFSKTAAGGLIGPEASGGHQAPLLRTLAKAGGSCVRVNPRHPREFASATGRRAKTDRLDAQTLARMGRTGHIGPPQDRGPCRPRTPGFRFRAPNGKRRIRGGRDNLRRALYIAGFIAARCDPKLIAILNAIRRDQAEYRKSNT